MELFISLGQQNPGNTRRELPPGCRLGRELRAALSGEPIELGPSPELRFTPLGLEPAAPLHAVQSGVEGALLDDDRLGRGVLDELGNGIKASRVPCSRAFGVLAGMLLQRSLPRLSW